MSGLRKKLIGSRAFYASVLALLVPMIVQQGITQFVNLLDNVMVGRLGTAPCPAWPLSTRSSSSST